MFSNAKTAYVPKSGITHQKRQGRIVTSGYGGTASFAIKAGYWLLAALTLIFVGMLVLHRALAARVTSVTSS